MSALWRVHILELYLNIALSTIIQHSGSFWLRSIVFEGGWSTLLHRRTSSNFNYNYTVEFLENRTGSIRPVTSKNGTCRTAPCANPHDALLPYLFGGRTTCDGWNVLSSGETTGSLAPSWMGFLTISLFFGSGGAK